MKTEFKKILFSDLEVGDYLWKLSSNDILPTRYCILEKTVYGDRIRFSLGDRSFIAPGELTFCYGYCTTRLELLNYIMRKVLGRKKLIEGELAELDRKIERLELAIREEHE